MAKKSAKKTPAKKTSAKKMTTKKPVAKKKAVATKPVAKKPTAKKPVAQKPIAKKTPVAKKPVATKPTAKKPVATIAKKPIAKRPIAKKPAAKKPVGKPAPTTAGAPDWRPALRASIDAAGPDFAAHLASLPAGSWEHASSPELAGLEHWGTELAKQDRRAGVGALVRVAQHGLPIIFERAGIGIDGMGFKADEPSADGAPVEKQVELAAAWLDAPDAAHLDAVKRGIDPSRQLYIWDEDLRPNADRAHWWYQDVGQCCAHAITRTSGLASADGYYGWPPETCVGRGLVIAVLGLCDRGTKVHAVLNSLRAVLAA